MKTTASILELLRDYECRNVTFVDPEGGWPIVWTRARGAHVWDAEGRRYLDLTSAFGVAAAGHANPRVVRAGQQQMATLLHAMGDVHPHALKARLARELSRLTFEGWSRPTVEPLKRASVEPSSRPALQRAKTLFTNSGFEAVEAALKTAMLATGKPRVLAFEGAYHGLGYGALNATHRLHFRSPFRRQLRELADFVRFPEEAGELDRVATDLRRLLERGRIGAVLVEPIQGRGGIRIPPPAFLPMLRRLCDDHAALLIADEIYTGFGRTGRWFACEHFGVIPDLICLGKALTGGFPLSACVGRAELMDTAWPDATGEAIHTSTFLGHPVGCAMALAQIAEIRRLRLVQRSARVGLRLLDRLEQLRNARSDLLGVARGLGLMAGLELRGRDGAPASEVCLDLIKRMLERGYILLPEGEHANVLSFTPPLTINARELAAALDTLEQAMGSHLNI